MRQVSQNIPYLGVQKNASQTLELGNFNNKKAESQEILIDDKFLENEKKLDDFENQSLDDFKRFEENRGILKRIKSWCSDKFSSDDSSFNRPRTIPFHQTSKQTDGFRVPNIVKNQKYTILNFIPKVLFEQFRYFFNLFFLVITLSQFIPIFRVGFLFSYVAPLVFVLTTTMLKEGYDDIQRYLRDQDANSQVYNKLTPEGFKPTRSLRLRVGDIIQVNANKRVPADMVILKAHDDQGSLFVRTDQLDGETDWKLRQALKSTSTIPTESLLNLSAHLTAEAPKLDIYDFKGVVNFHEVMDDSASREAVSLSNTLWANTFVATGSALGIVVYTGRQCRSAMNSREPRSKMGMLDKELNFLSKALFIFMCSAAAMVVLIADDDEANWGVLFFRHLLLLSSIIPISLRVNLDFSKMVFSIKINRDRLIEGALARNSTIPEELGRVSYILSDKTGTLTQNIMSFKKLSLESLSITTKNTNYVIKALKKQCTTLYPMSDKKGDEKRQRTQKRNKEVVVRDLVTALSLCHNVTPVDEDGQRQWQASSPDEIALVQIAEKMGITLVYRDPKKIVINTPGGEETYQIIMDFPFTSERKRMGIILKPQDGQGYFFYLKGADNVMKSKVPEVQRGFLMDECESLSREGLRTLVITQKYLTEAQFKQWNIFYQNARSSLDRRDEKVHQALEIMETGMELLGITGVEDMLQEDIAHTIDTLRNAGICIWMLTGDKVETAQCIAISTGLKSPQQAMFVIQSVEDPMTIQNLLNLYSMQQSSVLVIDGSSLDIAMRQCLSQFLQVSSRAPAVICCRCSPTQKALVTEAIKSFTRKTTLAIGDGGNDVAMIQAADVGVGIMGKEGKQAALASDFSIQKFKDIVPLLLWHGRLAYKRSSLMAQFVMHRGLVISVIQCIFSLVFYQVAIPIYNGWLMLGYSTVFTMLPVFCLIFDEDVSREKALEFAELYKSLLKGRELTWKTFLIWLWKSIYQGTVIMALSFLMFENTFIDLVTVTFTSLILIQILNVYSEINKVSWVTVTAQLITAAMYIICITTLREQINVASITIEFCIKVTALVLVSWLPLHLAKMIIRLCNPTETDKIMIKIHQQI